MTPTAGKRAGSRRGDRPKARFQPVAVALAAGINVAVIAWGLLVFQSIRHGQAIRGGDRSAWQLAVLYGVGAVICLFTGLILTARLFRRLGITRPPADDS
ncbi:MAG: hypothetical protein ACRCYU_21295 [Nocardioides sp.]